LDVLEKLGDILELSWTSYKSLDILEKAWTSQKMLGRPEYFLDVQRKKISHYFGRDETIEMVETFVLYIKNSINWTVFI